MENEKGKQEICVCGVDRFRSSFPLKIRLKGTVLSERECDTIFKDSPIILSYKVSYTYRCFCNCYLIQFRYFVFVCGDDDIIKFSKLFKKIE